MVCIRKTAAVTGRCIREGSQPSVLYAAELMEKLLLGHRSAAISAQYLPAGRVITGVRSEAAALLCGRLTHPGAAVCSQGNEGNHRPDSNFSCIDNMVFSTVIHPRVVKS